MNSNTSCLANFLDDFSSYCFKRYQIDDELDGFGSAAINIVSNYVWVYKRKHEEINPECNCMKRTCNNAVRLDPKNEPSLRFDVDSDDVDSDNVDSDDVDSDDSLECNCKAVCDDETCESKNDNSVCDDGEETSDETCGNNVDVESELEGAAISKTIQKCDCLIQCCECCAVKHT